jgi:hypothetical protein
MPVAGSAAGSAAGKWGPRWTDVRLVEFFDIDHTLEYEINYSSFTKRSC